MMSNAKGVSVYRFQEDAEKFQLEQEITATLAKDAQVLEVGMTMMIESQEDDVEEAENDEGEQVVGDGIADIEMLDAPEEEGLIDQEDDEESDEEWFEPGDEGYDDVLHGWGGGPDPDDPNDSDYIP